MPIGLDFLWAQVAPASPPGTAGNAAADLAILALRRWFGGLTLSSPTLSPRPLGLIAWLLGLLAIALVVLVLQGPRRAIGQFLDIPGHFRLIGRAFGRVRQAARLITVLLGSTVLAWSTSQYFRYADPAGFDNLVLLRRNQSPVELATGQGYLAAITPFRDVCGLGDNFPMLLLLLGITTATVAFRRSFDRSIAESASFAAATRRIASRPMPRWAMLGWGSAVLYALYRLACLTVGGDLPIGGALLVEAFLVPLWMLAVDGLLLAWVLVELRSIGLGSTAGLDVAGILALWPGSMLACLLLLPARTMAVTVWLLAGHAPGFVGQSGLGSMLQGWGLVWPQAFALSVFGLAGGLAWSRGGIGSTIRGVIRLYRAEGGRVLAVALLATTACGAVSAAAYLVLLTFPASSWLLAAADSYAHYATLPIALLALAALVELREIGLPTATPAKEKLLVDGSAIL